MGAPRPTLRHTFPRHLFKTVVNAADAGELHDQLPRDDEIYWAVPIVDMLVGSAYGEWIVPSASNPTTFSANQISAVTDFPVPPLLVSGGVSSSRSSGKARVFASTGRERRIHSLLRKI